MKWILTGCACIVTLCVIWMAVFCWKVSQTVNQTAKEITASVKEDNPAVETDPANGIMKFYQVLFNEIEQYGDPEQIGSQSAELVTSVFEKTLKFCTVKNITFQANGALLEIEGVCAPSSSFNTGMITSAMTKAAFKTIGNDFFGTAASVFQREEGMKRLMYGKFAGNVLEELSDEIDAMGVEPVHYTLQVEMKDGKWIVQSAQADGKDAS